MVDLLEYLICSAKNGENFDSLEMMFQCPISLAITHASYLFIGYIHPEKVSEIDGSPYGPNITTLSSMTPQYGGRFLLNHILPTAQLVTGSSDLSFAVGGCEEVLPEGGWRRVFEKLCAEVNGGNNRNKQPVLAWNTNRFSGTTVLVFGPKKGMFFDWKLEYRAKCWTCGMG